MNKTLMNRVNTRFEELVPLEGKADTLAARLYHPVHPRAQVKRLNSAITTIVVLVVKAFSRPFGM